MQKVEHDIRLLWPFRIVVAGSSGSGKSTLTSRLVSRAGEGIMTRQPKKIIVLYSHDQPAYTKLSAEAPCPVELISQSEELFDHHFTTEPGTLLIVDDLQASKADVVAQWFTKKAHHNDTSIIYIVQNLFDKSPHHRTISLNATYIVIFKNPRDASQISHLDRQMYPGEGSGTLTAAYKDVTSASAHSYIVADFNQTTPENFRLRNTLFPDEDFPNSFAYSPL